MQQIPLFDFHPVSQAEVDAWLFIVPRLPAASAHRATYAAGYRVADKIAAAKARGALGAILGDCRCPYCARPLNENAPESPDVPALPARLSGALSAPGRTISGA